MGRYKLRDRTQRTVIYGSVQHHIAHAGNALLVVEGAGDEGQEAHSAGQRLVEVVDEVKKVLFRVLGVAQQTEHRVVHILMTNTRTTTSRDMQLLCTALHCIGHCMHSINTLLLRL